MAYGVFRRPPRLPPPSQNAGGILSVTVATAVNADLAVTEQDDTLSASATLEIQASLAATEANDVASASGTVDIVASASITEGNDALAGTATLDILATASITEAGDVPSAASTVNIVGSLAVADADDTAAAEATLGIVASAIITEGDDTLDAPALMPIWYPRRGGTWDREEYERWLRDWQDSLRRIIDRSWRIASGEIDPVTFEPIPPADLASLAAALGLRQQARDQAALNEFTAEEASLQEEEAMAVLLLAA
jgi:hypothetical protein